jgi:hypothetical protein
MPDMILIGRLRYKNNGYTHAVIIRVNRKMLDAGSILQIEPAREIFYFFPCDMRCLWLIRDLCAVYYHFFFLKLNTTAIPITAIMSKTVGSLQRHSSSGRYLKFIP